MRESTDQNQGLQNKESETQQKDSSYMPANGMSELGWVSIAREGHF